MSIEVQIQRMTDSLPEALKRIRLGAGFGTLAAAEEGIEKRTGRKITRSMLSKYERGDAQPGWATLVVFLAAMGMGLADLQKTLDLVTSETLDADVRLGRAVAEHARRDAEFRASLADLLTAAGRGVDPELRSYARRLRQLDERTNGGEASPG